MPGFARADRHGDGTPIRPGTSGRKARADVPPGVSRYRISRLICGRPSSAQRAGSRFAPHAGPCIAVRGQPGHASPAPRLGRLAGRRIGGCGAQSEYIPQRSVVCYRAESAGAQQLAATGPQVPLAHTGRTVRSAVQVPCEHQREQADVATRFADRVVLGDRAELAAASRNARESPDVSQRGAAVGEQHRIQRGPLAVAVAAQAVGDSDQPAARIRPASSLSCRTSPVAVAVAGATAPSSQRADFRIHGLVLATQEGLLLPARRLPPGRQQIRKTCGVPAYLRVVIESDRTQASRTMNAETAQAATERVH